MKILVVNGPNINMLGIREPEIYGKCGYKDLRKKIKKYCRDKNIKVKIFQSNCEGKIITALQKSLKKYDGIIINPAGYTHTSIAIADAVKAINIPAVEVHISDINAREDFRKISYVSAACVKTVSGKGIDGYLEAVDCLGNIYGKKIKS